MMTSAACGRPLQQALFTETQRRPPLSPRNDEAHVGEHLDVVRTGRLADPELVGQLPHRDRRARDATAYSSRTRIGSARHANQDA